MKNLILTVASLIALNVSAQSSLRSGLNLTSVGQVSVSNISLKQSNTVAHNELGKLQSRDYSGTVSVGTRSSAGIYGAPSTSMSKSGSVTEPGWMVAHGAIDRGLTQFRYGIAQLEMYIYSLMDVEPAEGR